VYNNRQDEYLELFDEFALCQIVDKPTRGENILDLVFINEGPALVNVKVDPPFSSSDHNIVYVKLEKPMETKNTKNDRGKAKYDWSRADWAKLRKFLADTHWWEFFTEMDFSNVDLMWKKFKLRLFDGISQFAFLILFTQLFPLRYLVGLFFRPLSLLNNS